MLMNMYAACYMNKEKERERERGIVECVLIGTQYGTIKPLLITSHSAWSLQDHSGLRAGLGGLQPIHACV